MSEIDSESFWRDFVTQIAGRYSKIWPCAELFAEAFRCYKGESYLAAATMCRASLEALLHEVKTIDRNQIRNLEPNTRLTPLIEWAKGQHLLNGLESKIEDIKRDGDFGAHLAQKIDKAYVGMPQDKVVNIPIWIDSETARKRIQDTATVILELAKRKWP